MKQMAVVALALAFLTGCNRALLVTYQSDPPGAMLYEGGTQWGYAPFTLRYVPDANFLNGGCMLLQPSMVRWASGAEASIDSLIACASTGTKQQFVFVRPDSVPGRDLDAQFYIQMQQLAAQRQSTNVALLSLYNEMTQRNRVVIQQRAPIRCVSNALGGVIQTTCQ